ncbi:MAG: methionyl-tRNA formyltransferase [gamma proteobacterium symbiont of Bathyaustriella thionipta]|nr:methionyl-tRNA formyltransferase [gamma proteobacterium symbiont of Bathyaustriella thionipta]MCU7948745.1 methionyl-tRNA formyltransferase [gamma proteobacterium symbiont of Bathyaustriella thionipta]MCU7953559.1 methionyl-tRNA formyltransferase [gamma proteobacterium symbiont of Bathyaustriella thionipta]MCU7955228.1 methionyl-tRNA formyltransferase [gamma proteobacterium symbiont of Bathyaustriella thionipta]MCU7967036.1 methionyl-tRNA formyltransferase [gamma proteobacterium symbiont of 
MKVIFAGTPDFSSVALQSLLDSEHDIIAVYTQPDRPAGRGRKLTASPVKALALKYEIPVYQPVSLKDTAAQQELINLQADIMIVVAYGLILPEVVLNAPQHGCLNIHASILPRWRGAAPIQRAILAGDQQSGVTIMQMDKGLDTGNMLLIKRCDIDAEDTGSRLHDRLAEMGAEAILQTLDDIKAKCLQPQIQDDSLATYAHKLDKQEAQIDWHQDASGIVRKIQAFNSWPVAYTHYKGKYLRLWQACLLEYETYSQAHQVGEVIAESSQGIDILAKNGVVRIKELQMPGKKRIMVKDFINGQSLMGVDFNAG